jgi:Reverse transcriptase (RNA-dependent DNA polymerase)
VYIDDIIITGNSPNVISSLIQILASQFSLKDLGSLSYFLGIEVTRHAKGLYLTQTRYLENIVARASMTGAKPCTTTLQAGVQISKLDGTPLSDPFQYRTMVGALQYVTIIRPDLAFTVNKASQFLANPTDKHWKAVKMILRYIQGTTQLDSMLIVMLIGLGALMIVDQPLILMCSMVLILFPSLAKSSILSLEAQLRLNITL